MNRLAILIITLVLALGAMAADPFKVAKVAIKTKNNLDQAEAGLVEHATTPATRPSDRARACNMAAQVAKGIAYVENEKNYLKQPFDTLRYFSSLRRIYLHTAACDSIEAQPDERGRVRSLFGRDNRKMRMEARQNLLEGAKWLMRARRFDEAARYFDTYCSVDSDLMLKDKQRGQIHLWTVKCAYAGGNMPLTLRYADRALQTRVDEAYILEYKARAYLATGDTLGWERTLGDGMTRTPAHTYFFTAMNIRLRQQGRYEDALYWTRHVIEACPDTILYRYALSLTYFDMGEWDKCIEASNEVTNRDPEHREALFNHGVSWLHKAEAYARTTTSRDHKSAQYRDERNALNAMYEKARRSLEAYRRLAPDGSGVWAPLLYMVYFALNMGPELEEVEGLMK